MSNQGKAVYKHPGGQLRTYDANAKNYKDYRVRAKRNVRVYDFCFFRVDLTKNFRFERCSVQNFFVLNVFEQFCSPKRH